MTTTTSSDPARLRCCRWSPRSCWPAARRAPADRRRRRCRRRRPRSRKRDGRWTVAPPAEAQPRGDWWKAFADPVLDDLVERADRNNTSIQQAAARLAQARALVRSADADRAAAGRRRRAAPPRGRRRPRPAAPRPATLLQRRRQRRRTSSTCSAGSRGASDAARARRAVARGAAAEHAPAGAGRGRADLPRAARARRRARAGARAPSPPTATRCDLTERRYQAGDVAELDVARVQTEVAVDRIRGARARPPARASSSTRWRCWWASCRRSFSAGARPTGPTALPRDPGRRARARCSRAGPTSRPRSARCWPRRRASASRRPRGSPTSR